MTDQFEGRVIRMVAEQLGIRRERVQLETEIERGLGCTGDDVWQLMERLKREFEIDLSGFRFDRHFEPEHEPWTWFSIVWWLLFLPLGMAWIYAIVAWWRIEATWGVLILSLPLWWLWGWLGTLRPSVRRRRAQKLPVKVRDLVEAAKSKLWPFAHATEGHL